MSEKTKVKITLTKSRYGRLPKHRATIAALGLKKIHQSVIHENTSVIRGMIDRVAYLLKVEEIA